MRKLENKNRTKDKQGRIVLTESEQEEIKAFVSTQDNQADDKNLNSIDKELVATLMEQLATKDEQINRLQTLLSQQQSLTLQANERVKLLENASENEKQDYNKDNKADIKSNKGFWARLFNV